jgi:hypothetical protein
VRSVCCREGGCGPIANSRSQTIRFQFFLQPDGGNQRSRLESLRTPGNNTILRLARVANLEDHRERYDKGRLAGVSRNAPIRSILGRRGLLSVPGTIRPKSAG